MTPRELRLNAWQKLQSAKALIEQKHYDDASYLAGYTVELALKARYCTRKGLTHFPADKKEAKVLGAQKLLIHDLEELLTLSEGQSIQKTSMMLIDWDQATDWSAEQRYQPPGSVTEQKARGQIQQTERLFIELALFEVVDKLAPFEKQLSSEKGSFNLFVIADKATQQKGWELLMSAWWLTQSVLEEIGPRAEQLLDEDLRGMCCQFTIRHPQERIVQAFHHLPKVRHGKMIASHNAVLGYGIIPPAYVITNLPLPKPLAESQEPSPPGDG